MLRYGFTEMGGKQLLSATVDESFLLNAVAHNSDLEKAIDDGAGLGSIKSVLEGRLQTFGFDFAAAARMRNAERKQRAAAAAVTAVLGICNTYTEEGDPLLQVGIGSERFAEGRLQMYAEIRWPELPDDTLSAIATQRMREVAHDLRYNAQYSQRLRDDMVWADVRRAQGVTITTNPVGSCSLDTDGGEYDPNEAEFSVGAHNVYSRTQQFICLAGAVAIAHAKELVN